MTAPRARAGLIEVLVPTLDQLCDDLIDMNASTAVELDTWPAAGAFVRAWRPEANPPDADDILDAALNAEHRP